jgi:hypothetical protein
MLKKKHYLSEFSVSLCTSNWLLISADQLTSGGVMRTEDREIADQSHIYVVCRRPSLRFDPSSFKYLNQRAKGDLIYLIEGQENRVPFDIDFPLLDDALRADLSSHPHRELRTYGDQNKVVRYLPANALSISQGQHLDRPELANLEVLYVGQSFASGNRSAFERLQSHSTLQKILAEAAYESPDGEIVVAMFKYEPYRVLSLFDGRAKDAICDERDSRRFFSILERPLKMSQQISLAEAALIRYFKPRYNKIYKSKFPSSKQKVLASCYELDFSALTVEINTDDLHFRLFSEGVEPSMHHICKVDLFSHSDRAGFFFYTDRDGSVRQSASTIG